MKKNTVLLAPILLASLLFVFVGCGSGGGAGTPTTTVSTTTTTRNLNPTLLYRKTGDNAGDFFGRSAATLGNINPGATDTHDDFIVGANGADPGGTGAAYIYSGRNGNLLFGGPISGETSTNLFGWAVAGVGTIDAGAVPDFIVSAVFASPGGASLAGAVYEYSGSDGSQIGSNINGTAATDFFGYSLAGLGDINNDGAGDFVVGAPALIPDAAGYDRPGQAYVISGLARTPIYSLTGEANNDAFGLKVAGGGDINGDGTRDFLVGAPYADPTTGTNAGKVYVYSGASGSVLAQISGEAAGDLFGWSADIIGDINGDGKADFIVGAPVASSSAGKFYVFSGATLRSVSEAPGSSGDQLGYSAAGLGDINGDNTPDFIVSAIGADSTGATDNGAAYVYSGANSTVLYLVTGEASNDQFGWCVAKAGAVNGTGTAGFIVTSISTVDAKSNAGYVKVYVP